MCIYSVFHPLWGRAERESLCISILYQFVPPQILLLHFCQFLDKKKGQGVSRTFALTSPHSFPMRLFMSDILPSSVFSVNSPVANLLHYSSDSILFDAVPPTPEAEGVASPARLISCGAQVANSGIDTLHLSFSSDIFPELLSKVHTLKKKAQDTSSPALLELCGVQWSVAPSGRKLFPYVLRCGDVFLLLSSRRSDSPIPSAGLEIGSVSCLRVWEVYKRIKDYFLWNIGKIEKERVSRVDLFADITLPITSVPITDHSRRITRATKSALYESSGSMTGYQLGFGDVLCRCYDKLRELKEKKSDAKMQEFSESWGGVPYHVTRIEFQIRRERLAGFAIDRPSDLAKKCRQLWGYLTYEWLQLTENTVDRENKHQSRSETSPLWRLVQSAFGSGAVYKLARKTTEKLCNLNALKSQILGCFTSIIGGLGLDPSNPFGIFEFFRSFSVSLASEVVDSPEWWEKVSIRGSQTRLVF